MRAAVAAAKEADEEEGVVVDAWCWRRARKAAAFPRIKRAVLLPTANIILNPISVARSFSERGSDDFAFAGSHRVKVQYFTCLKKRIGYNFSVSGWHKLPNDGPALLVSTHTSHSTETTPGFILKRQDDITRPAINHRLGPALIRYGQRRVSEML